MSDGATLIQLLTALTQPDTNTIRQAEAALKPVLKNPASMITLWQVIADTSQPIAVRHVGAIILRKRLTAHYSNFDAQTKLEWQKNVLNVLASEQQRPVRSGLIGVAASLAQVEQSATQPYLEFLTAAANEANHQARELCFLLLSEMTDTIGLHWKEHIPSLMSFFTHVLNNPQENTVVHKAAVQAIGQLMAFWADEPEIESLAPLLPILLQVAGNSSVGQADDDFLSTVLDVLYELAYSPAPSLSQYMPITVEFALTCLVTQQLEMRVRDSAALVIATTAEAKSKAFGRHEALLGAVLDALFTLVQNSNDSAAGALFESNPAWKADLEGDAGDVDDGDMDSPTETSMAQGTLDMIACEVPKKFVWPACMKRCMERLESSDPNARKAGIACLGVIAEGCTEPLTMALHDVMPRVFAAAQDPAPQVRECACFCLGQISEHCQPDILQYSSQILPIVFNLLDDNNVAVQATSCYVLEMFCERLEPEAVRPVLDSLVRKLAQMLEVSTKRSVQEMAVAALAATAVAAEEEFSPYVEGVANLMTRLMQLQDPNLFSLRGRALECMGHMAIAVGRDTFRPYFPQTMQSAMEGLATDSTDLQEFAYAVFANLAKVMKEEFAPALPDLVPHLVKIIDMDEGEIEQAPNSKDDNLAGLDDSDDEDEDGQYVLHVRTALLEVKKGAITALGEMAAHTGNSFCPHLESCMVVLQKAAGNWHPLIKAEAADAFPSMIIPLIAAHHNGEIKWTKADLGGANPMSQVTATLVQAVLTEEVALMKDEDKTTVGKACEAVQGVIELCGPHALSPVLNDALQNSHAIISKSAPCQTADELYGDIGEFGDEDDDHDSFTQAACDLIGGFCRVMGHHFKQYLHQFLPPILEFTKPSRPASDRSMAVGCLSEIAQELEGAIAEQWQPVFMPAVLNGLADEDVNVKRNAAFCAGICCEHLKAQVLGDYPKMLQLLGQNFSLDTSASESACACVDNSAAAVARMIMASPENVPIDQVLPVFLTALPLKVDMTENQTVYQCLIGLLQMNHPEAVSRKEDIKRILTEATHESSKVDADTKGMLVQAVQSLH
mmetsp:Transcript_13102/g.31597  ORF Transcript_13102/g.31597 Transcript_13102/m.31597 type:complete len:1068 (-) Transcript_13102:113-3316(-)